MFYVKPKNVRYVDMAIYIDKTVYTQECDDNLIFEYLWHLVYILAFKKGFFHSAATYDDFAVFGATYVFNRLKNPKQFKTDIDGNPKLDKVKSCLNYIKKTLYPMKVLFENQNYTESSLDIVDINQLSQFNFGNFLSECVDEINRVQVQSYFNSIVGTIKSCIIDIPYKYDKVLWQNIYISCLLSLLSKITIDNQSKKRYIKMQSSKYTKSYLLQELYEKQQKSPIILFHLDKSMHDYIKVLVEKIKHQIAKEVSYNTNSFISSQVNMKNILIAGQDDL